MALGFAQKSIPGACQSGFPGLRSPFCFLTASTGFDVFFSSRSTRPNVSVSQVSNTGSPSKSLAFPFGFPEEPTFQPSTTPPNVGFPTKQTGRPTQKQQPSHPSGRCPELNEAVAKLDGDLAAFRAVTLGDLPRIRSPCSVFVLLSTRHKTPQTGVLLPAMKRSTLAPANRAPNSGHKRNIIFQVFSPQVLCWWTILTPRLAQDNCGCFHCN